MCLLLLSYRMHPLYPLIVVANRDEFYARPTAAAGFWKESPEIMGGRDLKDGGSWLGITKGGRFAALTNYRDPKSEKPNVPSRGRLVQNFLLSEKDPEAYLEILTATSHNYNGFSLIFGDGRRLFCYSNRGFCRELQAGIYGLCNCLLDTPWPKVEKGKAALKMLSEKSRPLSPKDLFEVLNDKSCPEDSLLPDTGVGLDRERMLSPIFIESPDYGTRSSTVLIIDHNSWATFEERNFDTRTEPWAASRFRFRISC